jgi:hypothetical protein
MSMNEFEERLRKKENDSASFWTHGRAIPQDFSEEEIIFARELDSYFALDKEQIPPYFVQTLLEPDDPRLRVIEDGFEHKMRARIFHRLNLRRRLFDTRGSVLGTVASGVYSQRHFLILVATCLLFLLFTVAFTSQSFVEGVSVLLHGARGGVYQVHSYPTGMLSTAYDRNEDQPMRMSLSDAQQRLHFPIYWPQVTPKNFALDGVNLYQERAQRWAEGPILELQYDYSAPGTPSHGSGEIAILEFKPNADVLQVIGLGAAQIMLTDAKGNPQAIYVDGQWVSLNRYSHRWVSGGRNELIYEQNGIVFWIVGDQRDGVDKNVLLNIAQSLQAFNTSNSVHVEVQMAVTQLVKDSSGLFSGDIIAVGSDDNLNGPNLIRVGPDQSPPERPVVKHAVH